MKRFQYGKKNYSKNADNLICRTVKEVTLSVLCIESIYKAIYAVHVKKIHEGILKTYQAIIQRYHGCTEKIISECCARCWICSLNKIQQSQPRLKPIISTSTFERVQIDLVDMRNHVYYEEIETVTGAKLKIGWNWIGHMIDHSRKLHVLWAQRFKTGN